MKCRETIQGGSGRARARDSILTVLAAACFVLQQLVVPIHLARYDHVYPHEQHAHHHERERAAHHHAEKDGHRPHPVTEHLDLLDELAAPPTSAEVAIAPAPSGLSVAAQDTLSRCVPEGAESGPRAPPPRVVADPRAPPVAS